MDARNLKDALEFIEKLRFVPSSSTNNLFKSFIQAFSNLRQGIWGLDEFDRQISTALLTYPDLWNEFETFRTDFEGSSWDRFNLHMKDFKIWRCFWVKVLELCTSSDQAVEFLKPFYGYNNIGKTDFQIRVENFLREFPVELIDEFRKLNKTSISKLESEKSAQKKKKKKRKRSLEAELVSEAVEKGIDDKSFQDADVVIEYDEEELNLSVPMTKNFDPESEKKMMSKEFEDALSKLDFHLHWVNSAVESVKKLSKLDVIEDIRKHLDNTNMRCITRLYASASEDVLERVSRNPERGVPVLLTRLEQKEKELLEIRDELCIVQRKTGMDDDDAMECCCNSLDFVQNYFASKCCCLTMA